MAHPYKQKYNNFNGPGHQSPTPYIAPIGRFVAKKVLKPISNKVYGRKEIEQAFRNRFNQEATRIPKMPEIKTVTKKKGIFGGTSYGTDVTPK